MSLQFNITGADKRTFSTEHYEVAKTAVWECAERCGIDSKVLVEVWTNDDRCIASLRAEPLSCEIALRMLEP